MRIDGSNNFSMTPHIARAYGVQPLRPIGPTTATSGEMSIAPARAHSPASHPLVAGRVRGAIEFDGVSVPRTHAATLNLYTRAADKIEAATAVQIGRTIDVKG